MNTSLALEKYIAVKPFLYKVVEKLEVVQNRSTDDETEVLSLTIILRSTEDFVTGRLTLSFFEVRELKLQPFVLPIRFTALDISSVQQMGWERTNYKIVNREQDADFSFICHNFTVTLKE